MKNCLYSFCKVVFCVLVFCSGVAFGQAKLPNDPLAGESNLHRPVNTVNGVPRGGLVMLPLKGDPEHLTKQNRVSFDSAKVCNDYIQIVQINHLSRLNLFDEKQVLIAYKPAEGNRIKIRYYMTQPKLVKYEEVEELKTPYIILRRKKDKVFLTIFGPKDFLPDNKACREID